MFRHSRSASRLRLVRGERFVWLELDVFAGVLSRRPQLAPRLPAEALGLNERARRELFRRDPVVLQTQRKFCQVALEHVEIQFGDGKAIGFDGKLAV